MAELDLPEVGYEDFLRDLGEFPAGILSLPARPWPQTEVLHRELLVDLATRLSTPLADALDRSSIALPVKPETRVAQVAARGDASGRVHKRRSIK